ncbi:MAG: alpha/beta hydrolase [Gemmatimonadota bacterium]|nr:alpha/beta hydrolase [Gemmatimonadota bacterium]
MKDKNSQMGDTMAVADTMAKTSSASPAPGTPDSTMQAVLDELGALNGKPIETLDAVEARKQPTPTDAVKKLLMKQGKPTTPPPGATMTTRTVAGAAGQLPANIYTPDGTGPFPVVVYYHGGGWVIANKDVYDGGARSLAINAKAVVISADYREAPEHKFPAAHDDALAVYEWALKNAASIHGDPKKVALAGESAGGNLAVATAIAAKAKGLQAPVAVISVYPIAVGDTTTPSYVENANAKPLNRAMMSWFFDKYQRTPADRQDPRINLVGANLAGLPPVTIINAQLDPLRSDGEMLADKIRSAGGTVDQKTYPGVTHEFFGMGAVHQKAKDAEAYAADALKKAFQ